MAAELQLFREMAERPRDANVSQLHPMGLVQRLKLDD